MVDLGLLDSTQARQFTACRSGSIPLSRVEDSHSKSDPWKLNDCRGKNCK